MHFDCVNACMQMAIVPTLSLQFLIFAGVGVIGTAGHYAVLIVLVQYAGARPLLASTAGYVVGAIINYILNYHLTFASKQKHMPTIAKFMTVALIGLLVNAAIMAVTVDLYRLHYLVSQILATALVLVWNFAANHRWTFRW